MKIVCALDPRETVDRRQIFQSNIDSGKWYSCVASIDLRYHVPILFNQGRYRISLPNAFRRLGLKCNNKKFFSAARTEAENMILQAAAILGENPPFLTIFEPAPKKKTPVTKDPSRFPDPCAVQLDLPEGVGARGKATAEAPFVWGAEKAFRRIQNSNVHSKGNAMLVYLAHLQISNEVRSHTYRTHTVHLELRSGRKRRAVVSANADLSRIGLLHIHRGHIVGTLGFDINAYTLCTTCIRSGGVVHQVTNPSRISDIRPFASCALGAPASPTEPASPRIRSEQQKTIKRVLAPDGERKLLGEIAAIVGPTDMQKNGGNWRNRIRHSALYRKALRHAVEDWKVRTPDQRSAIRNPAAWLTDRFKRAIVEIEKAQPPASAS